MTVNKPAQRKEKMKALLYGYTLVDRGLTNVSFVKTDVM
jgi:hypothetical protein